MIAWAWHGRGRVSVWLPAWAFTVAEQYALTKAELEPCVAALRRLRDDPLAQQLLLSHPDTAFAMASP